MLKMKIIENRLGQNSGEEIRHVFTNRGLHRAIAGEKTFGKDIDIPRIQGVFLEKRERVRLILLPYPK